MPNDNRDDNVVLAIAQDYDSCCVPAMIALEAGDQLGVEDDAIPAIGEAPIGTILTGKELEDKINNDPKYKALQEKISALKNSINAGHSILMSASNRQFSGIEEANAKMNMNGRSVPVLRNLAAAVGLEFDNLWIYDLLLGLEPGTIMQSYEREAALAAIPNKTKEQVREYDEARSLKAKYANAASQINERGLDKSKFSLILLQCHYLALKYPDKEIRYVLIDDEADKHNILMEALKKNKHLFPKNVVINFVLHQNYAEAAGRQAPEVENPALYEPGNSLRGTRDVPLTHKQAAELFNKLAEEATIRTGLYSSFGLYDVA